VGSEKVLGLIWLLLNVYLTHVHATLNKYACQHCINQIKYNKQATICQVTVYAVTRFDEQFETILLKVRNNEFLMNATIVK
jgi:hypothetical protein